jgi:sulfatase modifying factor 1
MTSARPWLAATAGVFVIAIALPARADEDLSLDLGGTTLELRRIPKGTFTQGSPANEHGHEKDEEAERAVTFARDFWIAKFPVTRGQFAHFVSDAWYVTEAEKGTSGGFGWDGKQLVQQKDYTWRNPGFHQGDDHPVVLVTYGDATAFAAWASRKTGKHVRLPTEAEYEYATRGKTTTPWYAGVTVEDALAGGWFKPNAGSGTHPVGQKKPNAFGLFDMSGNVYEWCRDVYAPSYPAKAATDPETTLHVGPEPERRVLRGGSWLKDPKRGRSAARFRSTPGSRNADYGFRVVVVDDDAATPALGAGTDFAPGSPVSLGQGGQGPVAARDAGVPAGAATKPGGEGLGWLLLAAPITAAVAVLAWMLGRRRAATSRSPSGATTRAAADGFFVSVPNVAPGTRVRYSCIVNGTEVTDIVPIEGAAETFVYTGAPPTAIQILAVMPPGGGGYREAQRQSPQTAAAAVVVATNDDDDDDDDDDSPSPPFAGYPRAY